MKHRFTFVLGASDPEMERVEALVRREGHDVEFASLNGIRVGPSEAYKIARPSLAGPLIAVECIGTLREVDTRIDHHRPGDPGYGRSPDQFWEASSIGQVYHLLGLDADEDARLAAASDHCPAAAYRGRCPGIDPTVLMTWRAFERATFQKKPVAAMLREIEAATTIIAGAPWLTLAPEVVAVDLRGTHVPEAPEASLRLGVAIIADGLPGRDGRRKVNILGDHDGNVVRAFLGGWAEAHDIKDTYGDPERGFAGGYL